MTIIRNAVCLATLGLSAGGLSLCAWADAVTTNLPPVADTRVFNAEWGWDSNAGNDANVGVYQSRDRSLLRFDLSGVPAGATITSAVLTLTATDLFGGNPGEAMSVYRLTQLWTEGGVTWNRYDGVTPWATAGGDFDGTVWASSTANPGSGQPVLWDITALAQTWASNTFANHGLILINAGTLNGLHFASKENGNASYRPYLALSYTTPTGAPASAWSWNGGGGTTSAVDGAGTWDTGTPWWNGAATAWADGNEARFGSGDGPAGLVNVAGTVAPASLWFAAPGAGTYALAGGTIDLGGAVRIVDAAVDAAIGSVLSNGGLYKQGAGRLTLTGLNTYSGSTTIREGALVLGTGGTHAAGPIVNEAALIVDRGDGLTLAGPISGTGVLTKAGAGTLALAAANSYAGGTMISGGVVRAENNAALGAAGGTIVVRDGASLDLGPAELWNYTAAIEIAGQGAGGIGALTKSTNYNASLQQLRSIILATNATIGGVSGARMDIGRGDWGGNLVSAPLHIDGQGHTLSLVGNIYVGILAGAQNLGGFVIGTGATAAPHSDNSFGSATVTVNGGTLSPWNTHTFANPLVLNGGFVDNQGFEQTYSAAVQVSGPVQFDVQSGGNINLNGSLSGTGSIRKIGGYSLLLGGDNSGFGGSITNHQSNVLFKNAAAGSAAATWVALAGANLAAQMPGVDSTIALGALAGAGVLANDGSTGTVTYSIGALGADTTFSGRIQDRLGGTANYVALTKVGAGTLTLSGPNTYTGPTAISGGTLRVTSAYLADGSTVSIEAGATNDLAFGGADVIQTLLLGGISQPAGFYNAATHPMYFAGSGSLLLATGTRIWDGAVDNNWDDTTANWNGLLWTNLANAVFTSSVGTITLTQPATAATLTFGTTADNFTGVFTGDHLSVAAELTAQGSGANDSGGPVLTFANDVTIGGDLILRRRQVTVSSGTFRADRVTATDSWGMFNIAGGTVVITNGIDDSLRPGGNTLRVTLTGGSLRTPYIKTTQAAWRPAGANSDGVELNGGTLYPATNSSDFIQMWDPGWGTRNQVMVGPGGAHIDTDGRDIAINRSMIDYAGAGTLTKSGAGTLTLTAVNSFSGGTTVNGGLLHISGQSGGNGCLRGAVTVNAGTELRAAGAGGAVFGYTGGAKIDTLNINGGLVDTIDGVNHLWNATVNFNGGELRVNGGLSDTNGYHLEWGNSAVNVASNNATAVIAGRIRIRPDASPNVNFDVAAGPEGTNLLVSAAITETGLSGITKKGAGTMQLAATNTFTGITVLEGGILDVTQLSDYGLPGSLGSRAADGLDVGVLFRGGTLRYRGATPQRSDRAIRLSTTGGGGTIDASGATPDAAMRFTATTSPNFFENPGDRVLSLIGSNTGSNLFGMAIGEAGGVTAVNKAGPGRWILGGVNTYSGPTIISNGTLLVNGSTATGAVSVLAGTSLGGTGVVGGQVILDGMIAPGESLGTLTVSNLVTDGVTAAYRFELGGTNAPTDYDQLVVGDMHTLQGTLEVVLTNGYVPASGDRFNILTNSALGGLLFGAFSAVNVPALTPGLGWEVQYTGTESASLVVTGTVSGGLSAYEQWAQSIPNPAQRGEQADPDGDGYANLLEYSQGTDATNSADNAKLSLVRTNGQFLVLFNRVNSATDIVYEVEGAYLPTNNALWLGIATNVIGSWGGSTNVNDNNTAAVHRVLVTDLLIGTNRSLRLKVTRP